MDKAELILYGVATYLAIKSLVALMSEHKANYKIKLAAELKASAAAAAPNQPGAAKPPAGGAKTAAKPQVAGKT
jgi:hypothetical protein